MLLGYNHNINYKGDVFHVQTEDSGVSKPHVITLLYREGVIISSKKTSYGDILKIENLEELVEDLMKEQHKEMMRRLKSGEFDARAFPGGARADEKTPEFKEEEIVFSKPPRPPAKKPEPETGVNLLFQEPVAVPGLQAANPPAEQKPKQEPEKKGAVNLDDAILNFFGASK